MLFNSFTFALFLSIVFIFYWILPNRFRWVLLLIANYYFYMSWNAKYVLLILAMTIISYVAALLIEKESNEKKKKCILSIAIVICLLALFFFKYFNFLSQSVVDFLNLFSLKLSPMTLKLVLPIGISFYTFQTLGYIIDVYRKDVKAEHHLGHYAVFISFFPLVNAGPIERMNHLLPQIKSEHRFDYDQATYGLKLMTWGYFKKLVIADTLSQYVIRVYDNPQQFQGFVLVLVTLFFSLQIYCDFSGYSDIAIGTAKLFGINLMTNFKSPYFSQSLKEFWSRWHISLSTWFRDYVYIALGGKRVGKILHKFNLIITFLISGLWHGANWTFVCWGVCHGIAQSVEATLSAFNKKHSGIIWILRVGCVFIFCSFAWIFFRADSINDVFYILSHMFINVFSPVTYLSDGLRTITSIGMGNQKLVISILGIAILAVYDFGSLKTDCIHYISRQNTAVRYLIYIIMLCLILFLRASVRAEFVYFQF